MRPNADVLEEQIHEAERAEFSKLGPLLPATYEWIKQLDHDIDLWGDNHHGAAPNIADDGHEIAGDGCNHITRSADGKIASVTLVMCP